MTVLQHLRGKVWLCLAVVMLMLAGVYGFTVDSFSAAPLQRVVLFFLMGVTGAGLVFCWPRFQSKTQGAFALLGLALLVRLALLPTAPSDDIYRYLWEGKLIRHGVSPYAQTADATAVEPYRDDYWAKMNHLDKKTAYPPLAELLFAGVGAVSYSTVALKVFFIGVDCLTITLLMLWLIRQKKPLRWVGFYAFNPVVLIAIAAEGHFDVLLVCAMVGALYCEAIGKQKWAWCLIGVAVQFKFMALLLVPFLWKRTGWQATWPFAVALVVPCLPFVASLHELFLGLNDFATTRSFNGFVYELLLLGTGSRTVANGIVVALFGGLLAWRFFRKGGVKVPLFEDAIWIMGGLLVLAPTIHFWYLTWVIPFLVFRLSLAWWVFCISQCVYFLVWHHVAVDGVWALTWMELCLMWVPFGVIGLYELRFLLGRAEAVDEVKAAAGSVSIVVPTYQAEQVLPVCLGAIRGGTVQPNEIILSDGGSTDGTLEVAEPFNVKKVEAPLGRGAQIKAGVEAACGETVLVLHADSVLPKQGLEALKQFQQLNPEVIGGALGQRFDKQTLPLLFIEMLNEARATLKGASFGDQGQFFFKKYAMGEKGFPDIALMEDVEMSQRLHSKGPVGYVGCELKVSADKWKRQGWWKRFTTVIRLVAQYRMARILNPGQTRTIAQKLYDVYYK